MSLYDFTLTPTGRSVSDLLSKRSLVAEMEMLAERGIPPVKAIDAALAEDVTLTNTEKQYVGRMVRDVLVDRRWRVGGQRRFNGGLRFSSGSWYHRVRAGGGRPDGPPTDKAMTADAKAPFAPIDDAFRRRMEEARALVRRFSKNEYGVDDFIRDKRAEAARDTER